MGIFINNQNRRREYQTIQDLQSQIQSKLSDPGISEDAKQAAQDALQALSSNISQQNMRKDVARQYTIDQMNTILSSLNSTSSLYKPTYVQAGPLRRIEIFDPTVLEDPLEIQGVDPVKKERVQAFAQNLATELKKYQTMLNDDSIALESWKVDNTAKIGQWLQDLALKDNMTETELDTKIAQMGRIVESLEHAGLIGSHSAYFSSFVPQEEEAEAEGSAADGKKFFRYGINEYEETSYPGPVGEIFTQKGYKVGKLGDNYYLFNATGPETITGGTDNFVLDPAHPAYKYAWYTAPDGKLTVGQVDDINFRNLIGEDAFQQLRTNIINEHKRKFPIEYYAAQGGKDIWDFSNYMRDEGAGAGIHIYEHPFTWEGSEFLMPWDQIFGHIPDWQQYFNYAGNTDRDEYGNPINNQYANRHHYIQNAELPKKEELASDEEFESFLNLELGNNYTIRKILPFNSSDPEQALTQAFAALLKTGDDAQGNLKKVSLKIQDLSMPLADRRTLKKKYGETISGEKLLYNYLFIKHPKVAKRLLMNIIQRNKMSSYQPDVDPQNAYGYMKDILKAKQGGVLKLQRGRIVTYVQPDDLGLTGGQTISTPTPVSTFFDSDYDVHKETTVNGSDTTEYMWSVDDFNKRWQNRVTSSLPLVGVADPDTERGKILSLDDIFKDPDTRNPLILRALSIGSDLAGAFAAFGTGPGTAVALGTGLASTGLEYWADWIDPTVSKEERRRNLGVNAGLTAVGAVPGMKFIQTAGKGVDFIRTLCKLVGGTSALIGGLGIGAQASDRIQELIANPDSREFTQEDLMLIMQILSAFIQRGTASKQKAKLNDAVSKTTVEGRRDVPFVGTDGQTVYVSMTEAQYKNYLNAGRNASADKGKAAFNEAKSYLSDVDATKLQGNDPRFGNFGQWLDRWRTPQFDGSLQWYNPASYKDMLTGNILRGTVRPEVANTPELPGPVKWAGVRQDVSPSLNAPTVTSTPAASGKAGSIEVYNGRVGQRDKKGRLTFKGLDFETAQTQKYARETTIPKEVREKGEKLNGEDFKQAMQHLGAGVPDGVTPKGGYVYNNKLYWWKQGGKLNRLSQYLNNK